MSKVTPKFQFGNIIVTDSGDVGVILKTWSQRDGFAYEIYDRSANAIFEYPEDEIKHFIYSKELSEEEKEFYK